MFLAANVNGRLLTSTRFDLIADDGSTAVEVALKMAFRAFMQQQGLDTQVQAAGSKPAELQVPAACAKAIAREGASIWEKTDVISDRW